MASLATFACTAPSSEAGPFSVQLFADAGQGPVERNILVSSGTNALQATEQAFDVQTQSFSFGKMVSSINGIASDSNHYWALYVDGNYSLQGAESVLVDRNLVILWKLEPLSQ
ncbi:MAG: DUF4430 domain-containing protein [Candidatus Diapherotrites archaeon]